MKTSQFLGAQESNLPPRQKERFGLLWTDGVNWEHISFARRSSGFESLSAHWPESPRVHPMRVTGSCGWPEMAPAISLLSFTMEDIEMIITLAGIGAIALMFLGMAIMWKVVTYAVDHSLAHERTEERLDELERKVKKF